MTHTLSRRRFLQLTATTGAAAVLDASALFPGGAVPAGAQATTAGFARSATGARVVDVVYRPDELGYWVLSSDGSVFGIDAPDFGGATDLASDDSAVALAAIPNASGYWIFTAKGRVVPRGAAQSLGDVSKLNLAGPIVDAAALPDGSGYYLLGSDGGIFSFGNARFWGSVPQVLPGVTLAGPVVGLVPDGTTGYWLVASDGGLFSFGTAAFRGSIPQVLGSTPLAQPIIGALASGNAYLMVGADGGMFSFGTTQFHGSLPGIGVSSQRKTTSAAVTSDRAGYMIADETGRHYGFGSASYAPVNADSSGPRVRSTHVFNRDWYDDRPYRWASDAPIHFVINNNLGPASGFAAILQAVDDIAEATGLNFVYDGTTTEFVDHLLVGNTVRIEDRAAYQPDVYGERWAPVWIGARRGFSNSSIVGTALAYAHADLRATETKRLTIDGQTGDFLVGEPTFVTGVVGYNWGGGSPLTHSEIGAVVRHELGHLVGLDHCLERDQLMFASLTNQSSFGVGDHLGLHLLGASTNHPTAPGPSEGLHLDAMTAFDGGPSSHIPIGGGCSFG